MNMDESKSPVSTAALKNFTEPDGRRQLRAQLRAEEWAMHQKLMDAARTTLDTFLSNPHRVTAQDVARLTEFVTGSQREEPVSSLGLVRSLRCECWGGD